MTTGVMYGAWGWESGNMLYPLAVVLVAEGQRRLRNRRIPMSFRGLPLTLLYLGMLALAIYGFTGHTLLI